MIQRNQLAQSADSPLIKYGLPVLVVITGVAIYGVMMALSKPPSTASEINKVPLVTVATVQPFQGDIEIDVNGLAVASAELELAAEVEGIVKIKTADCQVGKVVAGKQTWSENGTEQVSEGTTLIEIDSEYLENEKQQLDAKLQEAVGSLEELSSETKATENQIEDLRREVEIRQRELDRYLSLRETRSGAVSQSELDAAQLNLVKAENVLRTLQDQKNLLDARHRRLQSTKELAEAQKARVDLDLKRCVIQPPDGFVGVITEELIEAGQFVSRGTPLVSMVDTSTIEIDCNLQVDEYQQILENYSGSLPQYTLPGNEVIVTYRANGRSVHWNGKLTRTKGLGVDEMTRTMPCIVEVDRPVNEDVTGINTLVPGMFVKLRIQVPSKTPLVQVPAQALQGKNTIWVVKEGVLKKSTVEVVSVSESDDSNDADAETNRTLVVKQVDGLIEPGAQVVTTPITFQTDNQVVEVVASDSDNPKSAEAQSQGDENR